MENRKQEENRKDNKIRNIRIKNNFRESYSRRKTKERRILI